MNRVLPTEKGEASGTQRLERKYPDLRACGEMTQSIDPQRLERILSMKSPLKEREFINYCVKLGQFH